MAIKKKKTSMYDVFDESSLNDKVIIQGELVYGSILQKRVPKHVGPKDDGQPRYSITIKDPEIIEGADTDLGKALVNTSLTNSVYQNKEGDKLYSTASRSNFPINIFTKETGADSLPAPEFLENELNPGQTVGIMLSLYENKKRESVGMSLDGIIIESPENIDYFKSSKGADYSDLLGEKTNKLEKFRNKNASVDDVATTDEQADAQEATEDVQAADQNGIDGLFDD